MGLVLTSVRRDGEVMNVTGVRRYRPRRLLLIGAALVLSSPLAPGVGAAHVRGSDPDPGDLGAAAARLESGPASSAGMQTSNFTVVGHSDLGGGGLNADVWVHRGYAYVGVWSGTCPATGVKVADARRPHAPRLVSRLANPARTSAEDVVVRRVRTPAFTGDLAVVGIQTCGDAPRVFRGLQFWDVTHPARPRLLSRWRSALNGCHEVDLMVRPRGRVLAGCAEPFAEQATGADEVHVVDVTRPARPRKVSGFALGRDAGIDPGQTRQNVGCFRASFAHSVRFANQGRTLFASYWDVGTLRFDVLDRGTRLRLVSRGDIAPPDEDGDNHSMALARRGSTMIVNPEDFSPVDGAACRRQFGGWGEAHVLTNDRGRPRHLSTFSTPNSRSKRIDGFYSIHNTEVVERTQAFSSWYSDGIVWWSLADPKAPVKRGQFVPPPTEDPEGIFPPVPLVWGVYPDRRSDLVFASDINSGLWILRPTGLGDF